MSKQERIKAILDKASEDIQAVLKAPESWADSVPDIPKESRYLVIRGAGGFRAEIPLPNHLENIQIGPPGGDVNVPLPPTFEQWQESQPPEPAEGVPQIDRPVPDVELTDAVRQQLEDLTGPPPKWLGELMDEQAADTDRDA